VLTDNEVIDAPVESSSGQKMPDMRAVLKLLRIRRGPFRFCCCFGLQNSDQSTHLIRPSFLIHRAIPY